MPEIMKLLSEDKNQELLKSIFDYFEKISCSGDEELTNIFSITVPEILGNDEKILETPKNIWGLKLHNCKLKLIEI